MRYVLKRVGFTGEAPECSVDDSKLEEEEEEETWKQPHRRLSMMQCEHKFKSDKIYT